MIGTYLNLTLPTLGDNLSTIVGKTNTALGALRDSIADKASPAGLTISQSLSFGGNAATNLGSILLAAGNVPTAAGSIYYSGGEFYAIDATGTIKLTSLGVINASGIGGIGGDYGGVNPALESYDNASAQYRFYSNGGTAAFADLSARALILNGATGTVKLQVDPSVSTNDTLAFGHFTGSTAFVAWDGTKFIPAVAATAYGTGLTTAGDVTMSEIHRTSSGVYEMPLIILGGHGTNVAQGLFNITASAAWNWRSPPVSMAGLRAGDQINHVSVFFTMAGVGTKTCALYKRTAGGTDTVIDTTTSAATGVFTLTLTVGAPTPITTTDTWYIYVDGPATSDEFTRVTISANRP